ncbi:hypothetical protein MKEN_00965600 [Mycena kentingensis (nom. inval.)]|nr:hypothetical protein MKEN_00965600 [Mycena kentingensis (nom. inval.)]
MSPASSAFPALLKRRDLDSYADAKLGAPLYRVRTRAQSPSSESTASTPSTSHVAPHHHHRPPSPPTGDERSRKEKKRASAAVDLAIRGVSTMLLIPMPFLESVRRRANGKKRARTQPRGDVASPGDGEEEDPDHVEIVDGSGNGYMAYADYEPNPLKRLVSGSSSSGKPPIITQTRTLPPLTLARTPTRSLSLSLSTPSDRVLPVRKTHRKHNSLVLPDVPVPASPSSASFASSSRSPSSSPYPCLRDGARTRSLRGVISCEPIVPCGWLWTDVYACGHIRVDTHADAVHLRGDERPRAIGERREGLAREVWEMDGQ